ncbi:MAG: hypothetical protein QNJ30_07565 [Kiloniellales bacterium]|nr:hypothetical protein [Kiloniellales bacterium]
MATALRRNGYEGRESKSVQPDPAHSSPDRKAWIIHCETGSYRVRVKGARSAEITPFGE